jgi:sec-independent protein translocase protein TatA
MFSTVLLFFEFGPGEIMLIMFVTLLLFGGDKLPQLARGLGKGIRDFKDASEGVKREITNQIDNFETKKTQSPAPKTVDESPVAENESLVVADEKLNFEPPVNAVPIGSAIITEAEPNTPAEPMHLKETPIETPTKAHEEIKS